MTLPLGSLLLWGRGTNGPVYSVPIHPGHMLICANESLSSHWEREINDLYFIYFWLHWVFAAASLWAFSSCSEKGYSLVGYMDFSLWWLLLLRSICSTLINVSSCGMQALGCRDLSSCGSWALEIWLRSCGEQTWLLGGMWNLPGPTRDWTCVPFTGRHIFIHCTNREVQDLSFWPL